MDTKEKHTGTGLEIKKPRVLGAQRKRMVSANRPKSVRASTSKISQSAISGTIIILLECTEQSKMWVEMAFAFIHDLWALQFYGSPP